MDHGCDIKLKSGDKSHHNMLSRLWATVVIERRRKQNF